MPDIPPIHKADPGAVIAWESRRNAHSLGMVSRIRAEAMVLGCPDGKLVLASVFDHRAGMLRATDVALSPEGPLEGRSRMYADCWKPFTMTAEDFYSRRARVLDGGSVSAEDLAAVRKACGVDATGRKKRDVPAAKPPGSGDGDGWPPPPQAEKLPDPTDGYIKPPGVTVPFPGLSPSERIKAMRAEADRQRERRDTGHEYEP